MNETAGNIHSEARNAELRLIDELPLPYIEMDTHGIVTRANRAALELHPSERGDLIGKMAWDMMATDEREPSCAAYVSHMETGGEPPVVRRALYDVSGHFRTYELHRSLMRDAGGHPTGMRVLFVNVTQTRQALEEAGRVRQWLEVVLGSMPAGVIVADALGFIRYANPPVEELFGWKAAELEGKMVDEALPLVTYEADGATSLNFNFTLEKRSKGIATILDRNGKHVRVEIGTSPMIDTNHALTIGVVGVMHKVEDEN